MQVPQTTRTPILLVDDDPSVLAMLRAVLESEGHSITAATSGAEARQKLKSGIFSVVVTDMRMETETAGVDVLRSARKLPHPPAVVILTAYPSDKQQWLAEGAAAVLMKPTPVAQLQSTVDRLLKERVA